MNPLSFIPAPWLIWVRVAVVVLLVALCFGAGWKVKGAMDAERVAAVKLQHSDLVLAATKKTLDAQKQANAEREAKAAALATIDQVHQEQFTRSEHENTSLRADVAAGTRVVRVAATCPDSGRPAGVPQAAAGGSLDPAAGATLDAASGQAVLDLRTSAGRFDAKLPACQAALSCLTGQGACPSPSSQGEQQ